MTAGMIVIGAGETGIRAATTLRQEGYVGPLTLLDAETASPYERPPLSKQYLTGAYTEQVDIGGATNMVGLDIVFRPGEQAGVIDPVAHQVTTTSGQALAYDKLLIATGAQARRLSFPGVSETSILTLRTLDDANVIRRGVARGSRVLIIGGGFIGLELAASLTTLGVTVHVLEAQEQVLKRAVPGQLADIIRAEHEARGVRIHLSAQVESVATDSAPAVVTLAGGDRIDADLIIAGIGAQPNIGLAKNAGLAIDNGIAVDNQMRTSAADIFAAGDCCSFPHGLYANARVRLESWRCAQEQGEVAARNMLGGEERYNKVPWFWSDQFDLGLQIAGLPGFATSTVTRELGERACLLFHLDPTGRLLAVSGVAPGNGIARDIKICERLIQRGASPDPDLLADPAANLKPLLKK